MKYPKFIDNNAYMAMDDGVPKMEQLQAMLGNLTRIHLLSANKFESLDTLIHEYLISGIEVFGLETGIVSEINAAGDYRVCDVRSPLSALKQNQVFPLEDTYCREVAITKDVIGFPEVGKLDYMNCHPVYQNLKLEAYLSAPIFAGDRFFGTLNFTSVTARKYGFSKHEHDLILLMANSIGAYILLREKEDKLLNLNEQMKRFIGFVAHDLRNPIGNIISISQIALKRDLPNAKLKEFIQKVYESGEIAIEFVNGILDGAALATGKVQLNMQSMAPPKILGDAIGSVEALATTNNIKLKVKIEVGEDLRILCDEKRLYQSLMNILTNAIKYSPQGESVNVNLTPLEQGCKFSIYNKTATKIEQANMEEVKFYASVGFGLDIAKEMLQAHDSYLHIQQNETSYLCEFSLNAV